jgi:hypothetical protein
MLRALLKESRPKQWLKNVLVFAAPGALGALDEVDIFSKAVFTSGTTYSTLKPTGYIRRNPSVRLPVDESAFQWHG